MNKSESKYFNTALLMDEALLVLLERKEYEFITVKEICQKAGVNRSTFYLHYESMDDLLQETIETLNKRFYEYFNQKKVEDIVQSTDKSDLFLITPEYLKPYLTFIEQNKRAYSLFYSKPKLFGTEKTFNKMYQAIFQPILRKYGVAEEDMTYVFSYYSGGVIAVVKNWVKQNFDKPVDDVIRIITSVIPHQLAPKQ